MDKLKPCLDMRCGSGLVSVFHYGSIPRKKFYVVCNECGVRTKTINSESKAVDQWNNRPAESRIKAEGIREAAYHVVSQDVGYGVKSKASRDALIEYADKLEGK